MYRHILTLILALSLSACWQNTNPTTTVATTVGSINPRAGLLPTASGVSPQSLGGTSSLQISEFGRVTLSVDGLGTNAASGVISVEKPANATVRRAFLAAASVPDDNGPIYNLPVDGIKLDGVGINNWEQANNNGLDNAINSKNYVAEVTEVVRAKLEAAPAGRVNFTIDEVSSQSIDGEVLAVIFDDPNQPTNNTVVLLFGSQTPRGDSFNLLFSKPILKQPDFKIDFSLGISYSARNEYAQTSVVDIARIDSSGNVINNQRLTSDAGGPDDGVPTAGNTQVDNGALLTVGGLDDSNANPSDPNSVNRSDARNDDELYNLAPFLENGDTRLRITTKNLSGDDNILFAAFAINGASAVVNDGITLGPVSAINPVGTKHTVTATVQDLNGQPIKSRRVIFKITDGPNTGLRQPDSSGNPASLTDANGQVSFTYQSNGQSGTDEITAYYVINGANITANRAYKTWIYPEQITLAPPVETHQVGGTHTVTASLTNTNLENIVGREVQFSVISGPHSGAQGSTISDANGKASFTYTGPNVGTDTIQARFTDGFGSNQDSNTVKANWLPTQNISLTPISASNPVGTNHSVTATVTDSVGQPVVNTDVTITVQSGPHGGTTTTVKTDSSGLAKLTYPGTGPGTDKINASFVDNFGMSKTSNTVEATWTLIEKIKLEPLTATSAIGTNHTVTATLEDGLARPLVGRSVSFVVNTGPNAGKTGTGITDGNGKASFTYTGNTVGTDVIGSSFVSSNAGAIQSNTAQKIWTARDKTQIKCAFEHYGKNAGGFEIFEVRVQDPEVGINAIRIITQTNMSVIVPNFAPGSRDPLVIQGTQVNKAQSTVLTIEITNSNGETLTCDPAATLAVREKGRPVSETFNQVLHDEGTLRLTNGTPGLKRLEVMVNGTLFVLENLRDGEVRYLNILSALRPTNDNVVTLKASGVTGASGDILIWDGK
jgi:hypothetical protein